MTTAVQIKTAMVLAAGFGKRMRPLTDSVPKPLVKLDGKALIDHVLDRLVTSGIEKAVVNVHYLADQVEDHVARRRDIEIVISDERAAILETGGGIKKALPLLGSDPFIVIASDTVWLDRNTDNINNLVAGFDIETMDLRLLLAENRTSIGMEGRGDFEIDADGRLIRRRPEKDAPLTYASVLATHPAVYDDVPEGAFSNNLLFDRAIAAGRLFGHRLEGTWMHVGNPESLAAAEEAVARWNG